ncbi:hypothetical protein D3C83_36980 [compost metagenome]
MRGGAVDEGGILRAESGRMADRGARPAAVHCTNERPHVIRAACGHAKPHHVDQELLGTGAHRRGNPSGRQRGGFVSQDLRDGLRG